MNSKSVPLLSLIMEQFPLNILWTLSFYCFMVTKDLYRCHGLPLLYFFCSRLMVFHVSLFRVQALKLNKLSLSLEDHYHFPLIPWLPQTTMFGTLPDSYLGLWSAFCLPSSVLWALISGTLLVVWTHLVFYWSFNNYRGDDWQWIVEWKQKPGCLLFTQSKA